MKKIIIYAGILVMLATTSINAQVSIGKPIKPAEPYSALEIISNGEKGLRLPQLKTAQLDALAVQLKAITGDEQKKLAEGLMIFNTETKCMNYWNGTKWVSLCLGSSKINLPNDASGNYKLSGKICFDVSQTDGSSTGCGALSSRPNDFADTKRFTYTFIGSGYSELRFMVLDTNSLVSNTTATGERFTVTFKDNIASLAAGTTKTTAKKLTIIAQYKDNTGAYKQVSLVVSVQDCSCGCSVKSGANTWLTFMCYNLGAKEMSIAEQMNHTPTGDTDSIVYGALYQWGRKTDGHEKRNSLRYPNENNNGEDGALADAVLDGNGQVPSGHPAYGRFIKQNSGNYDWRITRCDTLWKDGVKTANDPCPTGWRVPTLDEWGSIVSGGTTSLSVPGSGSATGASGNKWTWNGSTATHGYTVFTDGSATPALFLPVAGYRTTTAGLFADAGSIGFYWSSTTTGTNAYRLRFYSDLVNPDTNYYRAFGYSVRCVSE